MIWYNLRIFSYWAEKNFRLASPHFFGLVSFPGPHAVHFMRNFCEQFQNCRMLTFALFSSHRRTAPRSHGKDGSLRKLEYVFVWSDFQQKREHRRAACFTFWIQRGSKSESNWMCGKFTRAHSPSFTGRLRPATNRLFLLCYSCVFFFRAPL